MWWAGSNTCDVYIGTRGFAACHDAEVLRVQAVSGPEDAFQALTEWLDQAGSFKRLNVWLSGGLCRPVYLKSVPGLRAQPEWERVAQCAVALQAGLTEPCEVWVERRAGCAGRMAAVVPQALLRRLLQTASDARRSVTRIAPWWSEVVRVNSLSAPPSAVLAVRDCDSLSVFVSQGREFANVDLYTPVLDDSAAQAAMARVLMNTDVEGGNRHRAATLVLAEGKRSERGALGSLTEWST